MSDSSTFDPTTGTGGTGANKVPYTTYTNALGIPVTVQQTNLTSPAPTTVSGPYGPYLPTTTTVSPTPTVSTSPTPKVTSASTVPVATATQLPAGTPGNGYVSTDPAVQAKIKAMQDAVMAQSSFASTSTLTKPTVTTTPMVTQPVSQTPTSTTPPSSFDTKTEELNKQLADINASIDANYQDYKNQVAAIRSGVYSAADQAYLDSIQASIDRQVATQKQTNANQLGGLTQMGIRSGRERYAPEVESGILGAEIAAGNQRISKIQNDGVALLATAKQAIESKNMDLLDRAMNAFNANAKAKSEAIQQMHDNVMKAEQISIQKAKTTSDLLSAEKDRRASDLKYATDLSAGLASGMIKTDPQTGNVFMPDDATIRAMALQQNINPTILLGQLNERVDVLRKLGMADVKNQADILQGMTTPMLKEYEYAKRNGYTGSALDYQALVESFKKAPTSTLFSEGQNLLDYTKQTDQGNYYIDTSGLTLKDASALTAAARAQGIPVPDAANRDALLNIDTARKNLTGITGAVDDILAKNALTRIPVAVGNKLADFFQTDPEISSFKTWRSAAIEAMRAMAGSKGLRINQAEIQTAMNNDIPTIYDTIDTARMKLERVNEQLNSWENSILAPTVGAADKGASLVGGSSSSPADSIWGATPF